MELSVHRFQRRFFFRGDNFHNDNEMFQVSSNVYVCVLMFHNNMSVIKLAYNTRVA